VCEAVQSGWLKEGQMIRTRALLWLIALLLFAGCITTDVIPVVSVELEILQENQRWVQDTCDGHGWDRVRDPLTRC